MKVHDLMTQRVHTCSSETSLGEAALIMWRNDCGILPVTDSSSGSVRGVITDRDICMGLATSGRRPSERSVGEVMSHDVWSVTGNANVEDALQLMETHRVRRLPVTAPDGTLEGILSLNDIVQHADARVSRTDSRIPIPALLRTMKAICARPVAAESTRPQRGVEVALA